MKLLTKIHLGAVILITTAKAWSINIPTAAPSISSDGNWIKFTTEIILLAASAVIMAILLWGFISAIKNCIITYNEVSEGRKRWIDLGTQVFVAGGVLIGGVYVGNYAIDNFKQ